MSEPTPDSPEPERNPDTVSRLRITQALRQADSRLRGNEAGRTGALSDGCRVVSGAVLGGLVAGSAFIARAIGLGLFLASRSRRYPPCSGFAGRAARTRWDGSIAAPALTSSGDDPYRYAGDTRPGCAGAVEAQRERTLASIKRIRAGLPSPRLANKYQNEPKKQGRHSHQLPDSAKKNSTESPAAGPAEDSANQSSTGEHPKGVKPADTGDKQVPDSENDDGNSHIDDDVAGEGRT